MSAAKAQIALVDDEKDLVNSFKELLEDKYDVTQFYCAEDYLNYINKNKNNPFEVVVTDYKMGATNGVELIQQSLPLNQDTSYILMSGFLDKEATLQAHNVGAYKILEKPVEIEQLEKEIKASVYNFQLHKIRRETKEATLKLKELCGLFDLFLEKQFDKKTVDNFFMQILNPYEGQKNQSFSQYVQNIETQLHRCIKMEEVLMKEILSPK